MPYKTKLGYLYIPCKRGDGELPSSKPKQMRCYNGMCGGYIDPADWDKPPYISDFSIGETLWIEIKKTDAKKQFCIQASLPEYGDTPDDTRYRQYSHFIDFETLAPYVEEQCPNFLQKVYQHKYKIPVVKLNSINASCIKDSKNINIHRALKEDVGQITAGLYTIGGAPGDNYPLYSGVGGFAAAIGANQTGDLTGRNTSNITETATANFDHGLAGFLFTLDSDNPPNGDPIAGHIISINFNSHMLGLRQEGAGNTLVENLYARRTINGVDAIRTFLLVDAVTNAYNMIIRNTLYDGNSLNGVHFRCNDLTPIIYVYNNTSWDASGGVILVAAQGNPNSIYSNNNVYSGTTGIDAAANAGIFNNNASFGNVNDYANLGGAMGSNNYGSDATAANGNWLVGVGNQINQVAANGWQSVNPADANFLDIIQGGIFDSAGIRNNALINRTQCIRGRPVPQWVGSTQTGATSVGAAEILTHQTSRRSFQPHIAIYLGNAIC